MAAQLKSRHFTPATTSCYICGKSPTEFKAYFNFTSHRAEYAAQTGNAGKEAEKAIALYYDQFVDHYSATFFEFYNQLMQFPAPLDRLPYDTIKSKREQPTLLKMFPELRDFDYTQLKTWGITQIPVHSWARAMRGGESNTIGEFKAYCTEIADNFTNKVVNRGIIKIIAQRYENGNAVAHIGDKPAFLDSLNENLEKLDKIIQKEAPEIIFTEEKWTQTEKNQKTIMYTYYLCPVCHYICHAS